MKFRLLSIGASGLVTLMGLGVTAVPAVGYAAQQGGIEEVVVTARKRAERLQDLPGSAAALNEAFLEQIGGINDLRDLTDLIPGIPAWRFVIRPSTATWTSTMSTIRTSRNSPRD